MPREQQRRCLPVARLRESEDQQDQSTIDLVEAFAFAVRAQPVEALRLARAIVGRVDALGIGAEAVRWAWPLGVRMADRDRRC